MKKLLIVLFTLGLAYGASAQKVIRGGGYHIVRAPRVYVGLGGGYGYGYSPFYNPFYSPWGSPYGYYGGRYSARPSKIDLQVQDIRIDYSDRIQSVKMDRSLKGRDRRHAIRQLKNQRDREIVDAKRDYYYNRSSRKAPVNNQPESNGNGYSE